MGYAPIEITTLCAAVRSACQQERWKMCFERESRGGNQLGVSQALGINEMLRGGWRGGGLE